MRMPIYALDGVTPEIADGCWIAPDAVLIGKVRLPDSREVVDYWLSRREVFLRYYDVLFEDEQYLLLERKAPSTAHDFNPVSRTRR